jgi:hypothetical protein
MPTRAEILDTLAASQTQVITFFQGLSPEDLERPATASDVPGGAPWRAKDHLAHLVKNERNIQELLRRTQGAMCAPAATPLTRSVELTQLVRPPAAAAPSNPGCTYRITGG